MPCIIIEFSFLKISNKYLNKLFLFKGIPSFDVMRKLDLSNLNENIIYYYTLYLYNYKCIQ